MWQIASSRKWCHGSNTIRTSTREVLATTQFIYTNHQPVLWHVLQVQPVVMSLFVVMAHSEAIHCKYHSTCPLYYQPRHLDWAKIKNLQVHSTLYIGILPLNDCCTKLKQCTQLSILKYGLFWCHNKYHIYTWTFISSNDVGPGIEMSLCLWCLLLSEKGKEW